MEDRVSIGDYLHPQAIKDLCGEIDMPGPVTEILLRHAEENDYAFAAEGFPGLFSLDTGGAAVKSIHSGLASGGDGLDVLVVYLAAALHTREIYARMGIPDAICIDTVKALSRFVREHHESFGAYGFDRGFWIYRCLSASLFRLGALEYEMRRCGQDDEGLLACAQPGDALLSVHIPSDAVMTREALDASYRDAAAFFARFFPDFSYRCIICGTWLLDPDLEALLPASSRIGNFRADYEIVKRYEPSNSFMVWLYKRKYDDLHALPENTSLQRDVKKALLGGQQGFGGALGILRRSAPQGG